MSDEKKDVVMDELHALYSDLSITPEVTKLYLYEIMNEIQFMIDTIDEMDI